MSDPAPFVVQIYAQAQRRWIEENCVSAEGLKPLGRDGYHWFWIKDPADQAMYKLRWEWDTL